MVGTNQDKIDGMAAVLGKRLYVEDLLPRGALCAMLLRSPHAHAEIKDIRTERALALAGVECVLTYRDVKPVLHTIAAEAYPEGSPYDRLLLGRRVRYVGDPVAVVAARDREAAEAALAAIEVDYEILPAVLDFEEAADNPVILHPKEEVLALLPIDSEPDRNIAAGFPWSRGDVDSRLADCDVVVQGSYYAPAQMHAMMETHRASCSLDGRGHLSIVSSCQSPFHVQRIVAKLLGIPQYEVRVAKPKVGGAFGGKNSVFIEAFVALVTQRTGKSCVMTFSRKECFEATNTRHQVRSRITLGADRKDGMIRAARLEVLSNTGAYGEHCIDVLAVACKNTLPIYGGAEALDYKGRAVYTNKVPAGAFRGFGAPQVNFGLESLVDELALKLGLDPIDFRLRNIIKEGQTHPFLSGGGPAGDAPVRSSALDRCIRRGAEMIGWKDKYPRRESGGDKVIGLGCSIAMHGSSIALMDVVEVELRLNYDGSFSLFTGASDLGTGAETVLLQYVGEVLHAPMERVRIVAADTETTPVDKGAYASSTTYATGNAVVMAATKLKAQLEEGARLVLGSERPLSFDGESFIDEGGAAALGLADFLARVNYYKRAGGYFKAEDIPQLSASARYGSPWAPAPYVAGFAELEVDRGTGELRLLKFVAVADCGTVINPKLARIQLEGGIVMGAGYALQEEVRYTENGRLLSNSFLEYRIPSVEDIPFELETAFEESYEPNGPFGAKSLGEVVVHTPPAAIANALFNATGARVRSLPLTPDKVLRALDEAGASR
jgi:CO/xanthine dehydrogenase Mo-binding subunit